MNSTQVGMPVSHFAGRVGLDPPIMIATARKPSTKTMQAVAQSSRFRLLIGGPKSVPHSGSVVSKLGLGSGVSWFIGGSGSRYRIFAGLGHAT